MTDPTPPVPPDAPRLLSVEELDRVDRMGTMMRADWVLSNAPRLLAAARLAATLQAESPSRPLAEREVFDTIEQAWALLDDAEASQDERHAMAERIRLSVLEPWSELLGPVGSGLAATLQADQEQAVVVRGGEVVGVLRKPETLGEFLGYDDDGNAGEPPEVYRIVPLPVEDEEEPK